LLFKQQAIFIFFLQPLGSKKFDAVIDFGSLRALRFYLGESAQVEINSLLAIPESNASIFLKKLILLVYSPPLWQRH